MKKILPQTKYTSLGFTLIELLVVIAIIAVLAVMGMAAFGGLTGKGNDDRRKADMKAFADAMEVTRAQANASVYSAPAATAFAQGVFPKEPTSRAEKYCYKDSTTPNTPVPNMNVVATACDTTNGWAVLEAGSPPVGVAPTVTSQALYFKFCTVNDSSNATRAIICQGSKQ